MAPDPATERSHWVAELVKRGMPEIRAELLASSTGVDFHAVAAALDAGCDPETAWRIWNQEPPIPRRRRSKTS